MNNKSILVYIEGEGGGAKELPQKRKALDSDFRKSWKQFLQPLADVATKHGIARFKCVPGRGRSSTFELFAHPLSTQRGALRILLIDSEEPVDQITKPWDAIQHPPPVWADARNCYLMVQCLETWLLADREKLREHYKRCFQDNKLKAWSNLEAIPRKTLQKALEEATSHCSRPYAHADGNLLIAIVDREKLKRLPSVARLFSDFEVKIKEYAHS